MDTYQLEYKDADGDELMYECQADNYEHAVEQLEDHEGSISGGISDVKIYNVFYK
jgi:hypothetical protein